MNTSISARELFEQLQQSLGLRWLAGRSGKDIRTDRNEFTSKRPSLAGYLNVIHPNKVQILGLAELAWLDRLDARLRWENLAKIIEQQPLALVISQGQTCPADLQHACEEANIALWVSDKRGFECLNLLQHFLSNRLAPQTTLHGVFMEIFSFGVLITGEAGAGKSELALELISRGHRLVADDQPEFTQITPSIIEGSCPALLQDMLEVRGLGIMNIRQMFGDTAVKTSKYLKMIVNLLHFKPDHNDATFRLTGSASNQRVLDMDIPVFHLPVAPGRNLAVLTEVAVRLQILRQQGKDPATDFMVRHQLLLDNTEQAS
jgi:HPr kinase/phosphorylase